MGLQQAGAKPADLRSRILAEERVGSGRKSVVQAIGLFRDAKNSDDKITAAALFYQGMVQMGQTADIGSFVKFLDTEEERSAMKRDLERFGKTMINLTASGEEVDIQERYDFIDQILSAESRFFREKAAELVSSAVFNLIGPEATILKTYAQFRKSGEDIMTAWRKTEQAFPAQAARVLADKKGPREVMEALGIQLTRRKAEATAAGKRDVLTKEEKDLDIRGKKSLVEAREALASVRKANASGEIKSTKDAIRAIATLASAELSMSFSLGEEDTVVKEEIARMKADIIRQSADLRKRQQQKGKASPQEEIRRKATDVMNKLFPGKNFQDLTPEEKQFVVNAVNEGA